jgi:hypothetical protein
MKKAQSPKNNENKSWMIEAKYLLKINKASQKSEQKFLFQRFSLKMSFSVCF